MPAITFCICRNTALVDTRMSDEVSKLYTACRNGDLSNTKLLLQTASLDDINQIEPNGSTCLHAASYNNHPEIVKVLLDYGASQTIRNTFNSTPRDEATTDAVRQCFSRSATETKKRSILNLTAGRLEWIYVGEYSYFASTNSNMNRRKFENLASSSTVIDSADEIIRYERFRNLDGMNKIIWFLIQARLTNDPVWFIKAISANAAFYEAINTILAEEPSEFRGFHPSLDTSEIFRFIGILNIHTGLQQYNFVGCSYGCVQVSKEVFKRYYRVGNCILLKSFVSTFKNCDVVEKLINTHSNSDGQFLILCRYIFTGKVTHDGYFRDRDEKTPVALDIETISEYPDEEEVLILPHISFIVKEVKLSPSGLITVQLQCINSDQDYTS